MWENPNWPDIAEQNINVFVSSTFHGMDLEREALARWVEPELRKLCRERGMFFSFIDLRWGITRDQIPLDICIHEIDRCRPFMIGIIGDLHGSVPTMEEVMKVPALSELDESMKESIHGISYTELEMRYGALWDLGKDKNARAFFYIRHPKDDPYSRKPESSKVESDRTEKLVEDIRELKLPCQYYTDPEELGNLVIEDLWGSIQYLYPDYDLDQVDIEKLGHLVFAEERCRVYIQPSCYNDLNEALKTGNRPRIAVGEPGCGKSALLSNWAKKYAKAPPEELLFIHFIGSTDESASEFNLMRRFIAEVQKRYDKREDIGQTTEDIRSAFLRYLEFAGKQARTVLVLDALNQLERHGETPDISWIPDKPPEGVHIVASVANEGLDDKALEKWAKRIVRQLGWHEVRIGELDRGDRGVFAVEYLKTVYHRNLDDYMISRICDDAPGNPLFLKTLLEELRKMALYGLKGEDLNKEIAKYQSDEDTVSLYMRILDRVTDSVEDASKRLGVTNGKAVRDAMSLIRASRAGLYEKEIQEIANIPPALWSQVILEFDEALISRMGLLDFFHEQLKKAVVEKYLPNEETERECHLRLAEYFRKIAEEPDEQSSDVPSNPQWRGNLRGFTELPYHLLKAGCLDDVHNLLTDMSFVDRKLNLAKDARMDGISLLMEDLEEAIGKMSETEDS